MVKNEPHTKSDIIVKNESLIKAETYSKPVLSSTAYKVGSQIAIPLPNNKKRRNPP